MNEPSDGIDVYFSYATTDRPLVEPLVERLRAEGLRVFWDQDIRPGSDWARALADALAATRAVLVCIGERGLESTNQLEEFFKSEAGKRSIVPILLPGAPGLDRLPEQVLKYQVLDYRDRDEKELGRLIEWLRTLGPHEDPPAKESSPTIAEWLIVHAPGSKNYAGALGDEMNALGSTAILLDAGSAQGKTPQADDKCVVLLERDERKVLEPYVAAADAVILLDDRPRPRDYPPLDGIPQLARQDFISPTYAARVLTDPDALEREARPRCPYRGREWHTGPDPVFHGRAREAEWLQQHLHEPPRLTIVTAPARSGKTSFLNCVLWLSANDVVRFPKAGYSRYWPQFLSGDPVDFLTTWKLNMLHDEEGKTNESAPDALRREAEETSLGDAHRRHHEDAVALLGIDQLERAFDAPPESTDAFLGELADAVTRDTGTHLVLSVRDDALDMLRKHETFGPLVDDALFELPVMNRDQLAEAITGPADEFSLILEEGLVEAILDDVGLGPDAIEAVSVVMKAVWNVRVDGRLTLEAYERLGGAATIMERAEEPDPGGSPDDPRELGRRLAGYLADSVGDDDQLDIGDVVEAFCSVMLSKKVTPPLSIGLFGDWGSGKSFFMEEMHRQVEKLAEGARREEGEDWHGHVAQIRFNAWTYSDANLWASLVTSIFDELSKIINPRETSLSATRANLLKELETSKELANAALAELDGARAVLATSERQLEATKVQLKEKSSIVAGIRRGDIEALLSDPGHVESAEAVELRSKLEKLTTDVGLGKAHETVSDLKAAIVRARTLIGRARATWADFRSGGRSRAMVLLAVVGLALPSLALVASFILDLPWVEDLTAGVRVVVVGVVQVVVAALGLLRIVPPALAKLDELDGIRKRLDRAAAERRDAQLETMQKEVKNARDACAEAQDVLARAERRVDEAQRALDEARAGRRFYRFIEERSGSEDYRQHLGLVSLIHRDFKKLHELLQDCTDYPPAKDRGKDGVARIDRIILYIDDLDRCKPEIVVEVLQAVHLLLALPLFVVVVGVDPRWLLRALEVHYPEFLAMYRPGQAPSDPTGDGPDSRPPATTPQNYLEKIFQIPFCLPAMDSDGFGRLIDHIARPPAAGAKDGAGLEPTPSGATGRGASGATHSTGASPGQQETEATSGTAEEAVDAEKSDEEGAGATDATRLETTADVEVAREKAGPPQELPNDDDGEERDDELPELPPARLLEISRDETEFMRALHLLIETPRSVKRFVNVYRLIRIIADEDAKLDLDQPRQHRPALALLALNLGAPHLARHVFNELRSRGPRASWPSLVNRLKPDAKGGWSNDLRGRLTDEEAADWDRIHRCFRSLDVPFAMPKQLALYQQCVPLVTRFAFWPQDEIADSRANSAATS